MHTHSDVTCKFHATSKTVVLYGVFAYSKSEQDLRKLRKYWTLKRKK